MQGTVVHDRKQHMSPDRRRGGGERGILEGTEDSKKSLVTGVALESGLKR